MAGGQGEKAEGGMKHGETMKMSMSVEGLCMYNTFTNNLVDASIDAEFQLRLFSEQKKRSEV